MFNVIEHNCGDCKLKCIDCNTQICPECMVQCPVGHRCKICVQRFTSHILQIDIWSILRSFVAAFVAGLLFSLLQLFIPSAGFLMLFLVYFFGTVIGNLIFKISGRKIGTKMAIAVATGLILGGLCLSSISLSLIVFTIDTIGPFLGWSNLFSGFFRH